MDEGLGDAPQLHLEARLLGRGLHADPVPHAEGVDERHGGEIEDEAPVARAVEQLEERGGLVDRTGEREGVSLLGDGHPAAGLGGEAHGDLALSTNTLYDETAVRSLGG